jgi:hypothetical protein
MQDRGRPEYTATVQAILRMLQKLDQSPEGTANPQAEQMESFTLEALRSLREMPNFDDIVSTSNDSGQTLVHLSVVYGYISLLSQLVEWKIDLTVADISGLTALHCAYLKEDRESIRILLRGGAPYSIKDKLGRLPRDLVPAGSDLADWLDGEIRTGEGSPPIERLIDREIALGEQFTELEAERDHENDSSHGEPDSDSDTSSNNDDDEQGTDIASPTLGPCPSLSKVSTLYVINQLLISKKSRDKRGPRRISGTPHEAAMSTVTTKEQNTEVGPAGFYRRSAIEYLCSGILLGGTITLEALKARMIPQDTTQLQAYRGLLSNKQEVFNCRLYPEDMKLGFKDSEEAVYQTTKSPFDMGYGHICVW